MTTVHSCAMKQPRHHPVIPRIEMREVSKHYSSQVSNILASVSAMVLGRAEGHNKSKRTVAVDKVSLSINAGEQVGIIGSNGAGKSTLLRMIAGLAPPTSGRLEVQGHVTAVFTLGLGLREDLTGRQNIYANGELQGKDREEIDQVIEKIIEFTDIGEFIDYPLRTYSTGMKSRLAFSMLMHIDPEILIIDEALSAGDGFFIDKAREKMTEICDRGKISIIVSHAMQSIVDMCTRCVWMEDGRVVMDGDPTGVTRAYLGSVRKRDETALVQKISGHVDAQSLRFGCQIVRFDLKALGRPGSQNIIFSGEDVEFHVGLRVDLTLGSPELRLQIVRVDGLVVVESFHGETAWDGMRACIGTVGYSIAMRPVVLGTGIYRATVELLDHREMVAMRSIVLEVVAWNTPTGGRPVLLYPCSVSAQQVG